MKRLLSTQNIIPESVIRIYKKGYGYTKVEVIESNNYYLSAQCSLEVFDYLAAGDTVEAYLWIDGVASFDFELEVIGTIKSGKAFVFFNNTDKISFSRDRKCLVADVDIPFTFFILDRGDLNSSHSEEKIIQHKGNIIKLSDREAVMTTDPVIHENTFIKAYFKIKRRKWEIIGKVTAHINSQYLFTFNTIHEKERNELLEYIFTIYRE